MEEPFKKEEIDHLEEKNKKLLLYLQRARPSANFTQNPEINAFAYK